MTIGASYTLRETARNFPSLGTTFALRDKA